MSSSHATPGEGEITVNIDGQEEVLRPTYGVARTLSTRYGGLSQVTDRVLNLDLDVITDIVQLGLGYSSSNRPPRDLSERIWRSGLTDDSGSIAERCVLFVRVLAHGGRLPVDKPEGAEGEPQAPVDPQ